MIDEKENGTKLKLKMLSKRPLSDEPKTISDFSEKYWLDGNIPYQYHTLEVEDGKNELEQLMINDIRALRNDSVWLRKTMTETAGRRRSQIEELKKENKHIKLFAAIMICLYAAFRIVTNGKDKKQ